MKELDKNFYFHSLNCELILINSLIEWRTYPEKSFRFILNNNFKQRVSLLKGTLSSKQILEFASSYMMSDLLIQAFMTSYEYLRFNIDDKMSSKLKNLRNAVAQKGSNLNTVKLLDAIRQSFAHNDIDKETPNWRRTDDFKIEINFKGSQFVFNIVEFHQFINAFLELKKHHFMISFDIKDKALCDAVKKDTLTEKNIASFFKINTPASKIELDKYQKHALINLIYDNQNPLIKTMHFNHVRDFNYSILTNYFPFKHNAGAISRLNNICFRNLFNLPNNFTSRQQFLDAIHDFEADIDLIDDNTPIGARQNALNFIHADSVIFEANLLSTVLFTTFSLFPPEKLQPYLTPLHIEAKRIRNSLMHGRYFYNNDFEFEFYDGLDNNNLEHVGTLSINHIMLFLNKFIDYNSSKSLTFNL